MEEVRRIRETVGLSQSQLARESGVDRATINKIEHGKRSPTIETLEKLASALGVEVADFFPKTQPLPVPLGAALLRVLREMMERYAPGNVLAWSREDLERIATRTDEATLAQFTREFEAGNDALAQEIAMSGGAVSALLRARARRAPRSSPKTSRLEAQAVEEKLKSMAA